MTRAGHHDVALALAAALSISTVGSHAFAQTNDAVVEADRLFQQGRQLMETGSLSEACPRFARSQALDPNTATLLNLAHCYELDEQWTRAWVAYRAAGRLALSQGREARLETAMSRAEALRTGRPSVRLLADGARLTVELDGIVLAPEDLGVPIPIARGTHVVGATATGKLPWRQQLTVDELSTVELQVGPLRDAPPPATPPPAPSRSLPPPPLPPPTVSPEAPSWWTAQRIAAASIGSLGLTSAVVASAFGGRTLALKDDIDAACPSRTECTQPGITLNDEAHRFALGSTVLFVAAGALSVTSVVLFATAEDAAVVARPTAGGAELRWRHAWD